MNSRKNILFISEIGINHNGSFNVAKKLIDQSFDVGCDYVKFQIRNIKEIYHPEFLKNFTNSENANQYIYNELVKVQLKENEYEKLFTYAKTKNLKVMVTPFDLKSLKFCKKKIDAIKIGSPDFENIQLIIEALKINKPLFLSTGMADEKDIFEIKNILKKYNIHKVPITIFHCVSSYPPNDEEINLKFIDKLKKIFPNYTIGYSGHERGIVPSLISLYFGSQTIERHITLDKNSNGPDHNSSLNKSEFKSLIKKSKKIINEISSFKKS